MNFYEKAGYGTFEASVVGNQATAFTNLYKQNESGDLMMEFRNPYEIDT
jgi:hypothetical protein